jgi:transcriptional regulator with GAF, ATPase, and Fis domain
VGETGTGKELVAQAIHRQSPRRRKPFVALDCGAIPETLLESELFGHERGAFTGADRRKQGQFQLAEGGTCFLDEVGNLPSTLQAKLLRVLESRQVQPVGAEKPSALDVRFVAATNEELEARAAQREFRSDLYFRLAQYTIALPRLRDRVGDIPVLTQRFVEEASIELRRPVREVTPAAIQTLQRYHWPGNVRELRNVIRRAVLQAKDHVIRSEDVQPMLGVAGSELVPGTHQSKVPTPITQSLREIAEAATRGAERHAICEALRLAQGNKSQAARALQTDFKTLHLKMRLLGVEASAFRS